MLLFVLYLTVPLIWGAIIARCITAADRKRNTTAPTELPPQDMYEI